MITPYPESRSSASAGHGPLLDPCLLLVYLSLVGVGTLAIYSATIANAFDNADAFMYLRRQVAHVALAATALLVMSLIPTRTLARLSLVGLVASMALLAAVFVPDLGVEKNGSVRWIGIGGFLFQPSEIAELGIVLFTARFVSARYARLSVSIVESWPALAVLALASLLLLLEPDFGSVCILGATVVTMLYLNGMRLKHLAMLGLVALLALTALIVSEPYRVARFISFMNPWADPYGSGFQLVQSLIAFGRGELFGTGLGTSVLKLFYLPFAGSDFLLAIIGEEFGFVGILAITGLFVTLIWRIFAIATKAMAAGNMFAAALSQGIGLLIAFAALMNMGVNLGMLPTKGLALPFLSVGGTSLIVYSIAVGIMLSIERETRRAQ